MKIGFVGLGKMGLQIVSKLTAAGHEVIAFDVNRQAILAAADVGAKPADNRDDLVKQAGPQPVIWLMIPADYVADEVQSFLELLPPGSVLIDGGNSHFEASIWRSEQARKKQVYYIDVGTSGGIGGLKNGFSMMVGGDEVAYQHLLPVFEVLSQPRGGCIYAGKSGSGHYVKMIHNGIEYALMQAYAEGYDLLKYGPLPDLKLAEIANVWQQGSIISSTLNGLVADILQNNPELDGIDGYVAASGEGAWTHETAEKAHVAMPALKVALDVRAASQTGNVYYATKLLAAMRNAFGGHAINKQ